MKGVAIMLAFLITSSVAISPSPRDRLHIGQQCPVFPVTEISNVTLAVSPWPFTAGNQVSTVLQGTMSIQAVIGSVLITRSIGTNSTSDSVLVNANYSKNSVFTFNYNFQAPIISGNYLEKYLVIENKTNVQLLCWQFSFFI